MLGSLKDLQSLLKIGTISIDNFVFKLHTKLTVIILIVFSIVVNSRQYFGDPIDCAIPNTAIANYVDSFCWFNSYSLVDKDGHVYTQVQKYINPLSSIKTSEEEKNLYPTDVTKYRRVKQTFYQWIGIVLFLQAAAFYFPRFLWKVCLEEGRVKELVNGIQAHTQDEDEFIKRQAKIIEYIRKNKGHHLDYFLKFTFCECLNFVNVIVQIFLTDWFLGHAFLNYGIQWIWYDEDNAKDAILHPSNRYFPKETVCDIYSGSIGGSHNDFTQTRCILPIHIFNEKIYLVLWFYFMALAFISGLMLIYRVFVCLFPELRYQIFARRAWATDQNVLRTIVYDFSIGDWFIVYQIMKNLDPFVFSKLATVVYENIMGGKGGRVASVERKHEELLSVYAANTNYDGDDEHFKKDDNLKKEGLLAGYFSRK